MTTLTDFLLARITEDEQVALAATENQFRYEGQDDAWAWASLVLNSERDTSEAHDNFIATWNPQRILSECEAKRRIIELHGWEVLEDDGEFIATSDCESCRTYPPCATIRALLDIYKNHPDAPDPYTQR